MAKNKRIIVEAESSHWLCSESTGMVFFFVDIRLQILGSNSQIIYFTYRGKTYEGFNVATQESPIYSLAHRDGFFTKFDRVFSKVNDFYYSEKERDEAFYRLNSFLSKILNNDQIKQLLEFYIETERGSEKLVRFFMYSVLQKKVA